MLFPPSKGAALADWWSDVPGYATIGGEAGQSLLPAQAASIPLPTCPFLVIAGGQGDDEGLNSKIPGDDDGTVGVEEARLDGGEFMVFKVGHTRGMNDPQVVEATLRFVAGS